MTEISFQINPRFWTIRRPHLYRHLEKQYVDLFFERGILRLSSFARFSKHKDEQRFDANEGRGVVTHMTDEGGGQTIMVAAALGENAYALSSSLFYKAATGTDFNTDSGFRINDSVEFAAAIARELPFFAGGMEGPCIYQSRPMLHRDYGQLGQNGQIDFQKDLKMNELCFLKSDRYTTQCEYRILWATSRKTDEFIDVHCPDAVKFCTRFEDLIGETQPL